MVSEDWASPTERNCLSVASLSTARRTPSLVTISEGAALGLQRGGTEQVAMTEIPKHAVDALGQPRVDGDA